MYNFNHLYVFDYLLLFLLTFFTAISLCSLEHLVTSLKSPQSQQTNNNYHSSNNQAFIQPQQHQLQIQLNGGDQLKQKRSLEQHISTPIATQTVGKLVSPKTAKASPVMLSSNGPVTDLWTGQVYWKSTNMCHDQKDLKINTRIYFHWPTNSFLICEMIKIPRTMYYVPLTTNI